MRYLDPGRNGGFAAGVNVALRRSARAGADVLLLNPDAVISTDEIAVLQRALRADARPRERRPRPGRRARASRHASTGRSPRRAATWLEASASPGCAATRRFVIGSVLLLRAEALDQVGGFDERFFLYAEETDWAYRAHRLGWRHAARARGARAARRCRHERRLRGGARRTSTRRRSGTCASTSARSAGSGPVLGAVARRDGALGRAAGRARPGGPPARGALPARAGARRGPLPHSRRCPGPDAVRRTDTPHDPHRADRPVHRPGHRRRRRRPRTRTRTPIARRHGRAVHVPRRPAPTPDALAEEHGSSPASAAAGAWCGSAPSARCAPASSSPTAPTRSPSRTTT